MVRYLVGPVSAEHAARYWLGPRQTGHCLAFQDHSNLDLTVGLEDTWEELLARLPADWRPDLLVLEPAGGIVPPALWNAPVPVVALARSWRQRWHAYHRLLPRCDLILAESAGAEALAQAGIDSVVSIKLAAPHPSLLEGAGDRPRDIDVLFLGECHAAQAWRHLAWLGRLASLAEDRGLAFREVPPVGEYLDLLGRARVVFIPAGDDAGERALDAAAAGALVVGQADDLDLPRYLTPGMEYLACTEEELASAVDRHLQREDLYRTLAQAGCRRARARRPESAWSSALGLIRQHGDELQERCRLRKKQPFRVDLQTRLWQAADSAAGDATLAGDLAQALRQGPTDAGLHYALGLAEVLQARQSGRTNAESARAAGAHFRRALEADPLHAPAAVALVEVLALDPQRAEAAAGAAQRFLSVLEGPRGVTPTSLEMPPFPADVGLLRQEWDRAAWQHAGDPEAQTQRKLTLLRWRLNTLLGRVRDREPEHHGRAAQLCPELPTSQAAWGCALARCGKLAEAAEPLRQELATNPFDREAARALFELLQALGDTDGAGQVVHQRRLLHRAAAQVLPLEPWFAETASAPREPLPAPRADLRLIPVEEFRRRFGLMDTTRALCAYTPPEDTHVVLTLLAHARPRRVLEVGTAFGHMTANLAEWSPEDALVYTLGTVADAQAPSGPQGVETTDRASFGRLAGHFGSAEKVLFVTADSLEYDFARLGELDFVFIDGAHDLAHVLSDTRNAYRALRPGGWLVWHDAGSAVPWVEVDAALIQAGLPEPIWRVAGTHVAFLHKSTEGRLPDEPAVRVVWEGAVAGVHSLGLVNRELCRRLVQRGVELAVLPRDFPAGSGVAQLPLPPELGSCIHRGLPHAADVHVRHAWPPDWTPPPEGHWVVVQPWEFGSLPKAWLGPLCTAVDEVWAYSRHVRETYIQSGVPAERVHVVPLGVDTDLFHPGIEPYPLQTRKRCKILFVGGTLHRKGFDALLQAYGQAFTAADDVCLVIKGMGVGTFYRGQTLEGLLGPFRQQPHAPEVEYLDTDLSPSQMASLYAACDCLAAPYRGEGFCLPAAEAMACGLPVIVTGMGAALDFCDGRLGYLIPARAVRLPEKRLGEWETAEHPWLAEPDAQALAGILRHVYEHPDEAKAKGHAAAGWVRQHLTWDHAADSVVRRLQRLRQRPIRRLGGRPAALVPTPTPPPLPPGERMKVSLCMIVKDEEHNIADCLRSAEGLFDEVIVVDTGSTDKTREVATALGAKVFDFPWCDSFSAARNESLRHATGDWIFWLDADDRLDEDNRAKLRALFASLRDENVAYSVKCRCLPEGPGSPETLVDHIRLFRNRPDIRWKYRIHEQILPAVRNAGGHVRWSGAVVRHTGYCDAALRRRKLGRDLRLLELEHAEQPEEPFTLFNLGSVTNELGRPAEALGYLRHSLQLSNPQDSIVRKLFGLIVNCHRALGQTADATAACAEGLRVCPGDAELLFLDSVLRRERGDWAGAEACLMRLVSERPAQHFASVDSGLRGYKARHNLGVICLQQGRVAEAEQHWRLAVADRPDFLPAWLGLGECALRRGDHDTLHAACRHVEALPDGPPEAAALRARWHLARREFAAARSLLQEARAKFPQAVAPLSAWSYLLLQEGTDLAAAEASLRQVLALEPGNAEAQHNLEILLRQRQAQEASLEGGATQS